MSSETDTKLLKQLLANSEKLLDLLMPVLSKPKTPPEKKLKKYLTNRDGKPKKPKKQYKPLPKPWAETIKTYLETGQQPNPFTVDLLITSALLIEPADYSNYAKAKIYKYLMLCGNCVTATKRSQRSRDWYWLDGEKIEREGVMQKYKPGLELCYYPDTQNPDELDNLI
jgi:hypothetical protein